MTLLNTANLCLQRGKKVITHELNFTLKSGEIWGVLGQNGVGKSTLLQALGGLFHAESGVINIQNSPIAHMSRKRIAQNLGLLFQEAVGGFPITVLESVLSGRFPHHQHWFLSTADKVTDLAIARAALQQVELEDMEQRLIDALSGGEKQRLAIATLLVQAPTIFLLDEPTNHLDLHFQLGLINLLIDAATKKHGAILMTLHDLNLASRFCTHLMLMLGNGEVACGTVEEMLQPELLERLYHHQILRIEQNGSYAFIAQ